MAYKFPWTNYHELNLDWILNTVKELFAKTEQNNAIVTQYDGRLTEVELTADNAQTAAEQAQSDSAAALSLAQGAQTTATQAQQAAAQAQQAAGQAQTAAGQAQEAAATAQQTATQAQQTAQNFDGRITQAENNAASALQAAQAFDEQVQGAITAANNANTAATTALTTATETARELAAQRDTLEGIITDATTEIDNGFRSIYPTILFPAIAMSRGTSFGITCIDGHMFGTVEADRNLTITGNENLLPSIDVTSSMSDGYFSTYLPVGNYTMHIQCGYAEYAENARAQNLFYAEKIERVPRYVLFSQNGLMSPSAELTAYLNIKLAGWYMLRLYFPYSTPLNIKYWLTNRETSTTAMLLENM